MWFKELTSQICIISQRSRWPEWTDQTVRELYGKYPDSHFELTDPATVKSTNCWSSFNNREFDRIIIVGDFSREEIIAIKEAMKRRGMRARRIEMLFPPERE